MFTSSERVLKIYIQNPGKYDDDQNRRYSTEGIQKFIIHANAGKKRNYPLHNNTGSLYLDRARSFVGKAEIGLQRLVKGGSRRRLDNLQIQNGGRKLPLVWVKDMPTLTKDLSPTRPTNQSLFSKDEFNVKLPPMPSKVSISSPRRNTMARPSKRTFERELSAEAVRIYRESHPNPNRTGCPDHSVLEQLAFFTKQDPPFDPAVVNHVFTDCWPCYNEICELRAKRRKRS